MNLKLPYSRQEFIEFLEEDFLPKTNFRELDLKTEDCKHLQSGKELGYCEALNLHIIELNHIHENDPRVTITRDAFKFLKNNSIDNALVIFKNSNSGNYRLSYLTITLELGDDNKTVLSYSNARRYSFYLGEDAKVETPKRQLINKGKVKDSKDLLDRFSLEVVNKEFYLKVAKCFDSLVSVENNNLSIPSVSKEDTNTRKSFAVRLIGRIVFCWFLKQKKSEYGQLIPEELLSLDAICTNYYHTILEPLFFNVLNTPKDNRDVRNEFFDLVPYLNGGLFSPQNDDYYEFDRTTFASRYVNTLKISDNWFKEFFDLLSEYNFTIDENTVYDQELSIDPEMLGRIFENLLAEINPETGNSLRKRTGSFYTPRLIVEYMVDQTIIEYLKSKTNIDENKIKAVVSYDLNDDLIFPLDDSEKPKVINAIATLKILDPACGSGAFPIGALQKIVHILQRVDPDCSMWLNKKLDGIPELYKQKVMSDMKSNPFDYTRKLDVIKDTIFGIDIQPIAVDVSRLRCFLTLIVESEIHDEKPNRGIEALPNLDFKFVCANSLISAPEEVESTNPALFEDDFQPRLAAAVDKYFSSTGENKRSANNEIHRIIDAKVDEKLSEIQDLVSYNGNKELEAVRAKNNKKDIEEKTNNLQLWSSYKNIFENKPVEFFDVKYFFPGIKDGFDIVIGNPPYVGEKGNKDTFRAIKQSSLGERFYLGKMDLFYYFFHFGLDVLKENGVMAFITTNYYITSAGGRKLRADFKKRASLIKLINFNELRIFESALGQHNMITILKKGSTEALLIDTCVTKKQGTANEEILNTIVLGKDQKTDYFRVQNSAIYDGIEHYIRIRGTGNFNNPIEKILEKVKNSNKILGGKNGICNVNTGLFTAADKIYILSQEDINKHLNTLNELEKSILKPFFKNSDINKYSCSSLTEKRVIYHYEKAQYDYLKDIPNIFSYLFPFKDKLNNRKDNSLKGALKRGRWDVMALPKTAIDFTQSKIVAPQRSKTNTFGYNEIPWYAASDVFFITSKEKSTIDLKYLLALLNSKLYFLWLYHRGKRKGETLELIAKPLSEIPIKEISYEKQKPFIELVDQILALTTSSDYDPKNPPPKQKELEEKIDELVFDLYELTPEERKIVLDSAKS